MATRAARAVQSAQALDRLVEVTTLLAESLSLEPPDIPRSHRDPTYLPTLQMEAVSDFLAQVVNAAEESQAPEQSKPSDKSSRARGRGNAQ